MKKKDYQEPTMKVVKLHHRTHLLQASRQTSGQVNASLYDDGVFTEENI